MSELKLNVTYETVDLLDALGVETDLLFSASVQALPDRLIFNTLHHSGPDQNEETHLRHIVSFNTITYKVGDSE